MLSRLAFRQNFACWNMTSLVLWNLIHFPFEPMPLASNRDLTLKNVLLEKCVDELHCIFFFILYSTLRVGWSLLSFVPEFIVKTQNPSISYQRFEAFLISAHLGFVGGNSDEMLLCSVCFV